MEILHEENSKLNGQFLACDNGQQVGVLHYHYFQKEFFDEDIISIDYTSVHDMRQGEGIASQLFDACIEFVKENDLKVIPRCPYFKRKFKEKPELKPLLIQISYLD